MAQGGRLNIKMSSCQYRDPHVNRKSGYNTMISSKEIAVKTSP